MYEVLLFLLSSLIYPIVESNCALGILLYLISNFETWYLPFSEYVMQGRCADPEFLGYSAVLFVVTDQPFSEFIQLILLFLLFLWKNIRYFDTIVSISRQRVQGNFLENQKRISIDLD